MQITIRDKSGHVLGSLDLEDNKSVNLNIDDSVLKDLISNAFKNGFEIFVDEYDDSNDRFVITKTHIEPADKNFGLALVKFLEANGYDVTMENSEIDEQIVEALKKYPDDENKQEILNKLPKTSHLQKTIILEELKAE